METVELRRLNIFVLSAMPGLGPGVLFVSRGSGGSTV